MSKTIWRFEINKDVNEIEMPKGAEILNGLHVEHNSVITETPNGFERDIQEVISIYAIVDTTAPMEIRKFLRFGTGANMDETANFELKHIGSCQRKKSWMCHVFEVIEKNI